MVHHIHYVIYKMDMISFHFKIIQFGKIGNITMSNFTFDKGTTNLLST